MWRFNASLRPLKPLFFIHRSLHHDTHFQNAGPLCSLLHSRSVIRFAGPDAVKFLQGLLTNDVRRFGEPVDEMLNTVPTPNMPSVSVSPMYAALLTPQGRFLYDFFSYKPPRPVKKLDSTGSGPGSGLDGSVELFADVDRSVLDELLQTLKRYRLRSKVEIENVAEGFSCWQRYGGNLSEKSSVAEEPEAASVGWGEGVDHSSESTSRGGMLGWHWHKDPRLNCLGFRGIFPSAPLVEADKETDEEDYLLWRVEKGVGEGSIEIPKGEAIPLEYNLVGLNAISFDKGCYVRQELIARTHHPPGGGGGVVCKRLLPLKFLNDNGKEVEEKVAPGSGVIDTVSGKKVGTVTMALGCRGVGVLRLDEAFKAGCLIIQGREDVKVDTIRPEWWPSDWYQDHEQHSAVA